MGAKVGIIEGLNEDFSPEQFMESLSEGKLDGDLRAAFQKLTPEQLRAVADLMTDGLKRAGQA